MTAFNYYMKIKDKVCVSYLGHSPEYLIQLRMLRKSLEKEFPGSLFHYLCKEQHLPYLHGDRSYSSSIIESDYSYTLRISYNGNKSIHPILDLIQSSNIKIEKRPVSKSITSNGIICPEGNFPTVSLSADMIPKLKKWITGRGFKPLVVGTSINETQLAIDIRPSVHERIQMARTAGFVIGVECDMLYEAIDAGIPTAIVGNSDLYKLFCEKPLSISC
jgi:hypothetical protein